MHTAWTTSVPAPTGPARTAKQSASSKPCCATGPTRPATRARITGVEHSPPGSATTTNNDPTAPSATRHPPTAYTTTDQRQWELHLALPEPVGVAVRAGHGGDEG